MVVLALDANFRLKNLRRLSAKDPGLHTGLAYFVESKAYLEHIAHYPRQKDVCESPSIMLFTANFPSDQFL